MKCGMCYEECYEEEFEVEYGKNKGKVICFECYEEEMGQALFGDPYGEW